MPRPESLKMSDFDPSMAFMTTSIFVVSSLMLQISWPKVRRVCHVTPIILGLPIYQRLSYPIHHKLTLAGGARNVVCHNYVITGTLVFWRAIECKGNTCYSHLMLCTLIGAIILSVNIQVGLSMHQYFDIGDTSSDRCPFEGQHLVEMLNTS